MLGSRRWDLLISRLVIVGIVLDVAVESCATSQPLLHSAVICGVPRLHTEPRLGTTLMYTEKECLTASEFEVLCDVKEHLKLSGIGITSHGTFVESLDILQNKTVLVFAFYPTPQLMRGSGDGWLKDLVMQTKKIDQPLTVVVVHSQQFLQRLQVDPGLLLQKGPVTDPLFPVADSHRFEQELNKEKMARLYRKAALSPHANKGTCGVSAVIFKNMYAAKSSEEWFSSMENAETQTVFFGEGAGLGMLSVNSMLVASEGKTGCTSLLLETLTQKLQEERVNCVNSNTSKLSWSVILPHLNGHSGAPLL